MAQQVKVVLNKANVRKQLLESQEMKEICEGYGRDIVSRCGEGYGMNTKVVKDRVGTLVYAETYEARQDNLKNNTILKAVGK